MSISIDEMIENYTSTFFNFIFIRIPMILLPHLLTLYVNLRIMLMKFIKQLKLMWSALMNTFDDTYIGFYEILNNSKTTYVPIVMSSKNIYNLHSKWLYDIGKSHFTLCEIHHNSTSHHIPFIGASVEIIENDKTRVIGDMSEWLMDQTIFGPNNVIPLQILASAWLYTNAEPKLLLAYKNMRMRIVNEDGEEKLYDLETENEIEE